MSEIKFRHALVALDQSSASDIIVDCLEQFSKLGTTKFTLFTSINVPYPGGLGSVEEERYKEKLEAYKEKFAAAGTEIRTEARFNINAYTPAHILQAAREHRADYIIIANRGHNKFREFLLGSTATELLQRCELPVYLINLSVSDEPEEEKRKLYCIKSCRVALENILYPTDFSPVSQRAFEMVKNLSAGLKNKINLLHVQAPGRPGMDDPEKLAEFDRIDLERLQKLKSRLQDESTADIGLEVRHGSPSAEILNKAREEEATMIVMGSQGRGFVSDLFLGGVCHQVVRNARIPVLAIPADRKK